MVLNNTSHFHLRFANNKAWITGISSCDSSSFSLDYASTLDTCVLAYTTLASAEVDFSASGAVWDINQKGGGSLTMPWNAGESIASFVLGR